MRNQKGMSKVHISHSLLFLCINTTLTSVEHAFYRVRAHTQRQHSDIIAHVDARTQKI